MPARIVSIETKVDVGGADVAPQELVSDCTWFKTGLSTLNGHSLRRVGHIRSELGIRAKELPGALILRQVVHVFLLECASRLSQVEDVASFVHVLCPFQIWL